MSDATGRLARWAPSVRALRGAGILVGVLLACALLGLVVGGAAVGIAALLGAASVITLTLRGPSRGDFAWFVIVLASGSAASAALATEPIVGLVVTLTVLALAPLVLRHGAVAGIVPVIVSTLGTGDIPVSPWSAVAGIGIGAVVAALVLRRLGLPRLDAALPAPRVIRGYLVLLASLTGLAMAFGIAAELPHAVWIVIAISTVLVPMSHDTFARARPRITGTVLGAVLGSAVATALPPAVSVALAVAALLFGIAHAISGHRVEFVALMALAVVTLIGAAAPVDALEAGATRIGLTVLGTGVAIAAGLALVRLEVGSSRSASRN